MTIVAPTGTLALERMVTGTDSNTWGDRLNANWARVDAANGYVQIDVSGLVVTLTGADSGDLTADAQARFDIIQSIGSPAAQAAIVFPTGIVKRYLLLNSTAQSVTFHCAGQPGVTLPSASTMNAWSNGQDIIAAGNVSGRLYISDPSTSDVDAITVSATADANGANIKLIGNGGISKTLRVVNGHFSIVNNAYNTELMTLDEGGNLAVTGAIFSGTVSAVGNIATTGGSLSGAYLQSTGNAGIAGSLTATGGITTSYVHSTNNALVDGSLTATASVTTAYLHSTNNALVDGAFTAYGSVTTAYLHSTNNALVDGAFTAYGSVTTAYLHSTNNGQIDGSLTVNGGVISGSGLILPTTIFYEAASGQAEIRASQGGVDGYFSFVWNGNATAVTGSWINGSDIRIKTNVETIPNALSLVCSMRGVSYDDYKSGEHRIGVIGNEMREVLPAATVDFDHRDFPDSPLIGVNYGGLVGPLIEAIKELSAKNDALSARLAAAGL